MSRPAGRSICGSFRGDVVPCFPEAVIFYEPSPAKGQPLPPACRKQILQGFHVRRIHRDAFYRVHGILFLLHDEFPGSLR